MAKYPDLRHLEVDFVAYGFIMDLTDGVIRIGTVPTNYFIIRMDCIA